MRVVGFLDRFWPVLFAPVLMFSSCGCSVSLEGARRESGVLGADSTPSERCIQLDNARTTWGAVAKGAAVVAGGTGVSTIPLHDEQGAQVAMAATSAAAAAVGAVAVYVAEQKGDAWSRECSNRGERAVPP